MNFVGMFLAFILGLLIGVLNYRISMLIISKKPDFLAVANIIHQAIAIVFLLVLYFAGPFTPFNRYYMLIGLIGKHCPEDIRNLNRIDLNRQLHRG